MWFVAFRKRLVYNILSKVDPYGLDSWSDMLRNWNVPQPSGLVNAYGHHIVFKGNFKGMRGQYVQESRAILQKFGIDINDRANLMWASNTTGVHTTINAKKVRDCLLKIEKELSEKKILVGTQLATDEMKKGLQQAGQDIFSCY